jgi:hypothetical protein
MLPTAIRPGKTARQTAAIRRRNQLRLITLTPPVTGFTPNDSLPYIYPVSLVVKK